MKTTRTAITALALSAFAGPALAQSGVYVSGLLHTPVGLAQLDPPTGRRLPVRNLGSSGQDGVEVQLNSAWGGGTGVEIGDLLQTAGGAMTARYKGWDGTIKGSVALASHGDGWCTVTADFGSPSPGGDSYEIRDAVTGQVLSSGTLPPGGTDIFVPWTCPDGSPPVWTPIVHETDFGQTYVTMGLACLCDCQLPGGASEARVMTIGHQLPPGEPVIGTLSVVMTSTLPVMYVENAQVATFDLGEWGLDGTQIMELCPDPADCVRPHRALDGLPLDPSATRGIAVDIRLFPQLPGQYVPDGGSSSQRQSQLGYTIQDSSAPGSITTAKYVKTGHVTLMKRTESADSAGTRAVSMDFTGVGAATSDVAVLDATGAVLAHATISNDTPIAIAPSGAASSLIKNMRDRINDLELILDGAASVSIPGLPPVSSPASLLYAPHMTGADTLADAIEVDVTTDAASLSLDSASIQAVARPGGVAAVPAGGVVLTSSAGALLVSNIGSSGQDGVDIELDSAWGGGVTLDPSPLLTPDGLAREIKIRPKGWDGTIKGRMSLVGHGDGAGVDVQYDTTPLAATRVHVRVTDAVGNVVADASRPPSGTIGIHITPVPGMTPAFHAVNTKGTGAQSGRTIFALQADGCLCDVLGLAGTASSTRLYRLELEADSDCDGVYEMEVTGSNVAQFDVLSASMGTFGVQCSGLGAAALSEDTDPATGERRLPVRNLGSSGQDGVAIDLGAGATSAAMRSKKCPDCPPGHVTLIKFTDDTGESFRASSQNDPATGAATISPDFSARGCTQYLLETLDGSGVVVQAQIMSNGGSVGDLCPTGQHAHWFRDYDGNMHYECVFDTAAAYRMSPINPSVPSGHPRLITITSDDSNFTVEDVTVTRVPTCGTADFNGDGDLGTDQDIQAFFACLAGDCCPTCGSADFNGDGDLGTDADIEAFFRVLSGGVC
jgi:hypothetical protein